MTVKIKLKSVWGLIVAPGKSMTLACRDLGLWDAFFLPSIEAKCRSLHMLDKCSPTTAYSPNPPLFKSKSHDIAQASLQLAK